MTEMLPYLAEHQPVLGDDPDQISPPELTPEEKKAAKLVDRLFEKAKKSRERYDRRWVDYYKFFRGDQWTKRRANYLHAECINFVFQAIQSIVPVMTEARPRPSFLPRDPSDMDFSEILNELFEADWQHGNWLFKITEMLYDSHIYGTGTSKLDFDPELDFGLGRITLHSRDPFNQYPDPEAEDLNLDDNFYIEAEPMDVERAKRLWAGSPFAKHFKADLISVDQKSQSGMDRPQYVRSYDREGPRDTWSSGSLGNDKVLVTTLYIKPSDVVEEQKETFDELGVPKIEYITKLKYPRGRKLVKINDFVVEDGELPLPDLKFPYQKHVNYILPREYFGISEVEQLESPQKIFNKLISFTLDTLTLMGNPIWLIPTSSGVKPASFTSAPGMQIPFDGPEPPRRVEGTQLQPYVLQLIDRMENWFNGIVGTHEVMRGTNPTGITAASAIEDLQNAAYTRIRQKMRNLDGYMTALGEQYVSFVIQHYSSPRIFRLTNREGTEKYFKFHVEPLLNEAGEEMYDEKGDPIRQANVTRYEKNPETGKLVPEETPRQFLIRGQFDVKINTGAGLPFAKAEKEQRLLQLFDRGIIDAEEVLKQSEYPNYEPLLQRMAERAQAQAAAMPQKA